MDYDSYLAQCVAEQYGPCEPELDGDGDAVNCNECENTECEYWQERHEPPEDDFDPGAFAEMQESLLWEE